MILPYHSNDLLLNCNVHVISEYLDSVNDTYRTTFMIFQPTEELIKEIAVLELEVICLEQHLLTLYRKAFEQQLCTPNSACDMGSNNQSARSFSCTLSEASVLDFSTPKKQQPVQSSRMVLPRKSTPTTSTSEAGISQPLEKMNVGRSHSSLLHRSICSARVSPSANNLARVLKPCHTLPLSFVEVNHELVF
jgi:hypothetical protein